MTAYLAEGKRLGISHPGTYNNRFMPRYGSAQDEEGLCITGCETCRQFRIKVRAALATETLAKYPTFPSGFERLAYERGYEKGRLDGILEAIATVRVDVVEASSDYIQFLDERTAEFRADREALNA